jgi:hypothetical protein
MSAMADSVRHELPIILTVLGTAVVFGVAVSVLPGIGRTSPEEEEAAAQYMKAAAAEKTDAEKAINLYAAIKPDGKDWHARAQIQIARLQAEAARRPPKPSAEEQAEYDALLEFWRQNAGDHDEVIRRGEAFVMAHPRGQLRPDVEVRIAHARQGRSAERMREAETTEAAVARYVERRDFAGALQAIEKVSERLRPELDVWPRLAARRDAVVAEARRHYQRQIEESNRLVKEGLKDDARRLWFSALRAFGDGKVPELADLHRAAALRAEETR